MTVLEHAGEQAIFVRERLGPRLEQARWGQRQVYFVDAAHFVFAPFLGFLWCAARRFVRVASGRKRSNVLGARDAGTHRLIGVANHDYINAESVCVLLRAVAETAVGLPITLVLDNARYQKCALVRRLADSLGIELLTLVANSRRRPTGRNLGSIGYPGERKTRFPTAEMNSPPVSTEGLAVGRGD